MKRTPIARISSALQELKKEYAKRRMVYLVDHWLCQASLLLFQIPEAYAQQQSENVGLGVVVTFNGRRQFIPFATEIHHRNKRTGRRLIDDRFFLSVCRDKHNWIESNPSLARAKGWLLDISANPDGMTPGGQQGLTTPQLFAQLEA